MPGRSPLVVVALVALLALEACASTGPPYAAVRPVSETHFGITVVDPYRWLENLDDQDVRDWLTGQDDYTSAVLSKIPGRAGLLARIKALDDAGTWVSDVQVRGDRYFYRTIAPGFDTDHLYVRSGLNGSERLLVDPEHLAIANQDSPNEEGASARHYSIDYFNPSPDGRYVAYRVSADGAPTALYVLDSASGRNLSDHIDHSPVDSGITWLSDGRSFYYQGIPQPNADHTSADTYDTYLHVLGRDQERDSRVFGHDLSPQVKVGAEDRTSVFVSAPYALGAILRGVQAEVTLYAAPASTVEDASTPWRKIVDAADDVTRFDVHGDDIYLLTHKGAARYKVVRMKLSRPDFARAEVVVPESSMVLTGLGVAKDALYVTARAGLSSRVMRVEFSTGRARVIPMPFDGAIGWSETSSQAPGFLVRLESWTKSPRWYAYDPVKARISDTALMSPVPVDYSQIVAEELEAPSADGTMVPISIVHQRTLRPDGRHPTWLEVYGAYGYTEYPSFSPELLAWLERRGVYAICHARGGGEYGEDWYLAGKASTKQHTIDDFIGCAKYLIAKKYTSPRWLAGDGGSAGGVAVGGAITQRPDLFAAAVVEGGTLNTTRIGSSGNGPANYPEFGDPNTAQGFKALYAMDAYQHVKDGVAYPAVMLTTGIYDHTVESWEPGKMAARLQAASSSAKPILLRVNEEGHGCATKSACDDNLADEETFLLWQLGLPDFQPKQ